MIGHFDNQGLFLKPSRHWPIQAREFFELTLVVWVGEHSNIEDVVGMNRNAFFKGKRFKDQSELCLRCEDQTLDEALELTVAQETGVDDVRSLSQITQQFTLKVNGLLEIALNVCV